MEPTNQCNISQINYDISVPYNSVPYLACRVWENSLADLFKYEPQSFTRLDCAVIFLRLYFKIQIYKDRHNKCHESTDNACEN